MLVYKGDLVIEPKAAECRKTAFKKKGKVDAAVANRIVEMYNDDFSYSEIAKECGVSKTTVGRTIKVTSRVPAGGTRGRLRAAYLNDGLSKGGQNDLFKGGEVQRVKKRIGAKNAIQQERQSRRRDGQQNR